MTPVAIATMILICGLVWGGFAALLLRAVRHEGRKRAGRSAGAGRSGGTGRSGD